MDGQRPVQVDIAWMVDKILRESRPDSREQILSLLATPETEYACRELLAGLYANALDAFRDPGIPPEQVNRQRYELLIVQEFLKCLLKHGMAYNANQWDEAFGATDEGDLARSDLVESQD